MIREKIKEALSAKFMTARALAEKAGVTEGQMSRFLSGKGGTSIDVLEKIFEILEIKLK